MVSIRSIACGLAVSTAVVCSNAYADGTLHQAKVAEWRTASASNRLDTAKDIVAAVIGL